MKIRDLLKALTARSIRAAALLAGLAFLSACGGQGGGETGQIASPEAGDEQGQIASPEAGDEQAQITGPSELVTAANFPVKLAVAPDGRLFYSEYNYNRAPEVGIIRIIGADGQPLEEPFAQVDVGEPRDWGLFGLAFDPEFETNHYVYAYLIDGGGQAVIMRFTDVDNRGTDPTLVPADLPQPAPDNPFHTGGGLLFGPDGYLYLSLGHFGARGNSQDLSILPGKILRLKTDGSAAPDNPFVNRPDAEPRIFAYGLRNVYDFTFHPITGRIYATDNGLSNCDELNIVDKGQNYGWPQSIDEEVCHNPDAEEAIYLFALPGNKPEDLGSNSAPTGIEFLDDSGELLLACEARTSFMHLLRLEGPNYDVVKEDRVIAEDCMLDIARAPDGTIYYSNIGEIRRLVPELIPAP